MLRDWLASGSMWVAERFTAAGRRCANCAEFWTDASEWFETSARWADIRDRRKARSA